MLTTKIKSATYITKWLQGGTVGDVRLISGLADTEDGRQLPYKVVLKRQKKWSRFGDANSWRREYDLYVSGLSEVFSDALTWPKCYHAQISNDVTEIWMEFVEGVSGKNMHIEMYERVAKELGRFQGKLYVEKPIVLTKINNLSNKDFLKSYYLKYVSWKELYDYVRLSNCEIPIHLCNMIVNFDDSVDVIWERIEKLPIVFCHRDFWVENIFCGQSKINLIDWDTTGWGYLGEDIASLVADEVPVDLMLECYQRCIPAYYKGFSEYADIFSYQEHNSIWEMIVILFGYRLVEWFKYAKTDESKQLCLDTLQKIYEMRNSYNEAQ